MISLNDMRCCGCMEIDGLASCSTPRVALANLAWYFKKLPEIPFVTFTGVVETSQLDNMNHARSNRTDNYGEAFAKYIEDNGLGSIIRSSPRRSFSHNVIQLWIWQVDHTRLVPFLRELENG